MKHEKKRKKENKSFIRGGHTHDPNGKLGQDKH